MPSVERILCPVDPSTDSGRSLRYAAALAQSFNARLVALTCVKESGDDSRSRRDAEEALRQAVGRAAADVTGGGAAVAPEWEAVVVAGSSAAELITREAAERRAELIVMCSRRRPLRAALIGSTAERVYRSAHCPVLITHPDQRGWEDGDGPGGAAVPTRVLVAHDFSDHAESALSSARTFARGGRAELHLLHVLPAPVVNEPELAWDAGVTEGAYHRAARRLQQVVPPEARHWRAVKSSVRWGKPYREILAYAKENKIDLVCMGAHGAGFDVQALFGSNVDRVLRQSPCPVLVARPLRPAQVALWAREAMTVAATCEGAV